MNDGNLTVISVDAIVLGASAGGLKTMINLFSKLPGDLPVPILVVQHTRSDEESLLAELIGAETGLKVIEAEDKMEIKPGCIYIAPPNYHLLVEDKNTIALSTEEKVNYSRPSIDLLFESAVRTYLSNLAGIILTGANDDGAKGISMSAQTGGITIAQSPESAEFKTMPQAAIATGNVKFVLDIDEMAKFISDLSFFKISIST
ncbi:MAG: chemotaxis protein CheB [Ignavibacteriales bacterium]|nr:chemotaxis protein CheB [Ignavibacteriales bacterium]